LRIKFLPLVDIQQQPVRLLLSVLQVLLGHDAKKVWAAVSELLSLLRNPPCVRYRPFASRLWIEHLSDRLERFSARPER
jgi:hypothetical protein